MRRIGAYEVLEELGRGGMGVVYRGYDPALNRPVAIKVIRMDSFTAPDQREFLHDRLIREARSAGSLSHPGIVTVYHIGQEQDLAYIVMQFVAGVSFEKMLASHPAPDWKQIISVLRKIGVALDYAHSKGVIHRDVKPANVLIDQEDEVKICDFGIAKTLGNSSTHTGLRMGSPMYMSPEQVKGDELDGRSDQYSLVAMSYVALTGSPPFHSDRLEALFFKIVMEPARPADELNPKLGAEAAAVIERGLSKNAKDRYATCSEFVTALNHGLEMARIVRDETLDHARDLLLRRGPKEAQEYLETQTLRYLGDAEFDSLLASVAQITHIEMEQQLRETQLHQGTQKVDTALEADQWREAQALLASLENDFPGEPVLIPLAIRVEQAQRKAAARERTRKALEMAREHLARKDFAAAARALSEIDEEHAGEHEVLAHRESLRIEEEAERLRRRFLLDLRRTLEIARGLLQRGVPREALAYLESYSLRFGEKGEFKALVAAAIEANRVEEERRQREEQLRQEEERRRKEEELPRAAQHEAVAREAERLRVAAAQEAKRIEDERRRQEEERKQQVEEEWRRADEVHAAAELHKPPAYAKPEQPRPMVWQIPAPSDGGRTWVAGTIAFLALCLIAGILYFVIPGAQKTSFVAGVQPPASTVPAVVSPPAESPAAAPKIQERPDTKPSASKTSKGKSVTPPIPPTAATPTPETKAAPEATSEDVDWRKAVAAGSADAMEAFLRAYPSTAHKTEATLRLEQLDWNSLQPERDPTVWRAFLTKYPSGMYAKQAAAMLEDLEWARVNRKDAAALTDYIQTHPNGAHTKQAETIRANIATTRINTALQRYLSAISQRNEVELQAAWPSIPKATLEQWRRDFQSTQSIITRITTAPNWSINGETARADCNVNTTKSYPGNAQVYSSEAVQHITLRKAGAGWVVESIH